MAVFLSATVLADFKSSVTSVAVIWLAVGVLAVRDLQSGLQPERAVKRYQAYRSAILREYDEAGSRTERYRLMIKMEQLAFDEMHDLLIGNERSSFAN